MKNIPEKIFLVVSMEEYDEDKEPTDFNSLDHEFVCWSDSRNNKSDIEYVLSKVVDKRVKELQQENERLREACQLAYDSVDLPYMPASVSAKLKQALNKKEGEGNGK